KEFAHPFALRLRRNAATVPSASTVTAAAYQCCLSVSLRVSDMLRILLGCSCGFDGVLRLGAGEAREHPGAHQDEADNGGREIGRCQHRERGDARPLTGEAGRETQSRRGEGKAEGERRKPLGLRNETMVRGAHPEGVGAIGRGVDHRRDERAAIFATVGETTWTAKRNSTA